jgi:enamidase
LADVPPESAIAAATGNNARVYRLNSGVIAPGREADIAVIDACSGGSQHDALAALANGDVAAVSAVVTDGVPRFVGRSRNTPEGIRRVRVAKSTVMQDFAGTGH